MMEEKKKEKKPTMYKRIKTYFGYGPKKKKPTHDDSDDEDPSPPPPRPAPQKPSSLKKESSLTNKRDGAPPSPPPAKEQGGKKRSNTKTKKGHHAQQQQQERQPASLMYADEELDAQELEAMVAAEVAKVKAKFAKPPVAAEPKPLPPQYAKDVPLKPLEKRQKPHKWMEPPDIKPAVGAREPDPDRKFVPSEHARQPHVMLHHVPLAERTYARYPPGTGPYFGGPTFPPKQKENKEKENKKKKKEEEKEESSTSSSSAAAAANTVQFVVIVTVLCFAPILVELARVVLLGRRRVAVSMTAWIITSVAVMLGGVGFFNVTRKPFTRWLLRVACSVGVNEKDVDVVVAGVAGITGAVGCVLTYSASVAIQWLLVGRGWGTFLFSLLIGAASVVFHEHRTLQRSKLKRALTVYYDAEKNAEGLNALMGKGSEVNKSEVSFAVTTPQWIRYQDAELVGWLNVFLARTWPFYNRALCNTVRSVVEPLLEEHRPGSIISKLYFDRLDLGDVPIQINNVKLLGSKSEEMGLSLEFDIAWVGRSNIMLNAKTALGTNIAIGVKDVEVYAKVQITLQPLTPTLCPFGGLLVTLTEKPLFEFDLELPLGLEGTVSNKLQDWLETFLSDVLGEALVWPERIVVPVADDELPIRLPSGETVTHKWYVDNVLRLRNIGIICIDAKCANHVPSSDLLSKSDAYMRVHVKGPTKAKTEVIMNNNDPEWNESLYVLVDDVAARQLTIEIMDSDEGDFGSDDVIGKTTLPLDDLTPHEPKDMWLEFPETQKRNARNKKPPMTANIEVTYIPFDAVGSSSGPSTKTQSGAVKSLAGIGMLTARLVRGTGLKSADSNGFSDPFCKVFMHKAWLGEKQTKKKDADLIKYKSKVIKKTLNPEWNEIYEFVGVRYSSYLHVECYDRDTGYITNSKDSLGSFKFDISQVFDDGKGGTLAEVERDFKLEGDKTIKGTITMKLQWQPFSM